MKLVMIGILLILFPLITWWVENLDPDKLAIIRMADRDRRAQAVRMPNRALRYAEIKTPAGRNSRGSHRGF